MEELEAILETGGLAAIEYAASALAEHGGKPGKCPNCHAPMIGPYCAVCGQPHNVHRRSVHHLAQDFFKDILSFDSRILRTAYALVARPGELPLAFREGRTQRYVPAVRLYLFVSLLFFLFLSATGIALVQFTIQITSQKFITDKQGNVLIVKDGETTRMGNMKADAHGNVYVEGSGGVHVPIPGIKANGNVTNTLTTQPRYFERIGAEHPKYSKDLAASLNELKKEAGDKASESGWIVRPVYKALTEIEADPAALNGPLTTWIPRILFLLVPLFALLLALFYRRQKKEFYFVDHLVFSLTMHTFAFVALIAAATAAQLIAGAWVAWLTTLALTAYFVLSIKKFYHQDWVWTGLKSVGIGFTYVCFFVLPAFGIAVIASAMWS